MSFSTATLRLANTKRRNALWLIVAVALVVADVDSAFANLISFEKPCFREQLILSLDNESMSLELSQTTTSPFYRIGFDEWYEVGAGGRSLANRPKQPASATEPVELFKAPASPLVGLTFHGQSSGAGPTPSDSSGGFAGGPQSTVLDWIMHFPLQPTRSGWLKAVEVFSIPPAPPFELLRPPQQLTILA